MKRYSFLLLSAFLAVACGKSGSGGSDKSQYTSTDSNEEIQGEFKVSKQRKTELLEDFSNFSDFIYDINSYQVRIEGTNKGLAEAKVECEKVIFDGLREKVTSRFDDKFLVSYFYLQIHESDPMEVEYNCEIKRKEQLVDSVSIKLKKSIVVTGERDIFSLGIAGKEIDIQTLVLNVNSELSTDGHDVNLNTSEIISYNGKIVTFSKEKANSPDVQSYGRSGGEIKIKTKKAQGKLTVELRGQNGAEQTKRPPVVSYVPPTDPHLNGKCNYSNMNKESCSGKRGHPGQNGQDGFDGFNGGATGTLDFVSEEKTRLKLVVTFHPGKRTAGTPGAKGGKGGPGGKGKTVVDNTDNRPGGCIRCGDKSFLGDRYVFPDGPEGFPGKDGKDGINGADGEIQNSFVSFLYEGMSFSFDYNWKNF